MYFQLFKFAAMKDMAYPQDFFIWTLVDLTWTMIGLGFFRVLLFRMPNISGWTFNELALMLGLVNIIGALMWGLMYGTMKELVRDINKGNLDIYLTKPVNSQFLVSSKEVSFSLFPKLFTGLFLVSYGLIINNKVSLPSILVISVSVLSSVVISYALYFITVTCALLFGRLANVAELFPHTMDTAAYPVSIFHPSLQFLFTFIIPFAMIGFYPASIILERVNYGVILSFPIAAVILLLISNFFWNFALKRYSSASS